MRRWVTVAAIVGVLALLAVVLYLLLEPLHRDDNGAAAAASVGYLALPGAAPARGRPAMPDAVDGVAAYHPASRAARRGGDPVAGQRGTGYSRS